MFRGVFDFSKEEVAFYKKALSKGFKVQGVQYPNISICGAVSINSLVIDPKGDIYKCWNEVGRSNGKVGNIDNPIAVNNRLLDWLAYDPFESNDCIECTVFPICMGGCPYYPLNKKENKFKTIKYNGNETIHLIKEINQLIKDSKE